MADVQQAANPATSGAADRKAGTTTSKPWIPGEVGIWVLILTDLTVFALYFGTFFWERDRNPDAFARDTDVLSPASGALNTAFMVTASLMIVLAVQSVRAGQGRQAQRYLLGAGACGMAFIIKKPFEWWDIYDAGYGANYDQFFQLYYLLTGLHLAHVVAVALLVYLWRLADNLQGPPTPRRVRFLENSALYWHLVDAIWLVLFALFYLVR